MLCADESTEAKKVRLYGDLPSIGTVGMPGGDRTVRLPAVSALHSASKTDYGEAERLLRAVVADGFMLHCCGPKAAPLLWWRPISGRVTSMSLPSGALTDTTTRVYAAQRRRIDVFAPEAVVLGMKGRRSGRCGHYLSWYTRSTLMPPPALILLPPLYTYRGLSNARQRSGVHHLAGPASALPPHNRDGISRSEPITQQRTSTTDDHAKQAESRKVDLRITPAHNVREATGS